MNVKNSLGLAVLLVFSAFGAEPTVVERGPHHRTVQHVEEMMSEDQTVTTVTNTVIEMATGLHVFSEAQNAWIEASPRIQLINGKGRVDGAQHKATFSGNINDPQGAVEIEGPDGRKVRIRTLGLLYTDPGSGDSVLFAPIRNTQGQTDENVTVLYENCFQGVKADIRIRSLLAGVESDVIVREMLPPPSEFGLANETARLEVLHEILEGPQPGLRLGQIRRNNGQIDPDHTLDFGAMSISLGNAFSLPPPAEGARHRRLDAVILVSKEHFEMDGRKFFCEAIPYAESAALMNGLVPEREEAFNLPKGKPEARRLIAKAASQRASETTTAALTYAKPRELAMATGLTAETKAGFVIDYASLINQANFTFNGASTYFCVGDINLTGVTTIEGGTVVKFGANNTGSITIGGTVVCKTDMYLPAVFTGRYDTIHGEAIFPPGSSANTFANYALRFTAAGTHQLSNLVFKHANYGVVFEGNTGIIQNSQFYDCARPAKGSSAAVTLRNALFHKTREYIVTASDASTITGENWTAHEAPALFENLLGTSTLTLKNSILAAVANESGWQGSLADNSVGQPSSIFASGGTRGAHYLANQALRDAGTDNIAGLAELRKMTTIPPLYRIHNIVANTTLAPRPIEDTGAPDLGYHYPPIDFCFGNLTVSATLLLTNGVRVAAHSDKAVTLNTNGKFISEGKPTKLNRIFRYSNVQEQPETFGNGSRASLVHLSQSSSEVRFAFTELPFASAALGGKAVIGGFGGASTVMAPFAMSDCFVKGGYLYFATLTSGTTISCTNNVFSNTTLYFEQGYATPYNYAPFTLNLYNNLFHSGTTNTFLYRDQYGVWTIKDNFFNCASQTVNNTQPLSSVGYNAYRTGLATFGTGGGNQTGINTDFTSGPLGDLYYADSGAHPSSAYLRNRGSRLVTQSGLVHHGTHRNGTKETPGATEMVDIGFHYVATDALGNPIDGDLDRLPDYGEDFDRDGTLDATESDLANSDSDGDGASDGEERVAGTNPRSPGALRERRLAYWSFNENYKTDRDEDSSQNVQIAAAPSERKFSGAAIDIESDNTASNPARLSYKEIGVDGIQNFSRTNGTIRFWFRPEWVTPSAPANGQLLSLGAPSAGNNKNWWSLFVNGGQIGLTTEAGATTTTHFNESLGSRWTTQRWHEVAVGYSKTNVTLYLDGAPIFTSTTGPHSPNFETRVADHITFGNANGGGAAARGLFDEIETFNHQLTAAQILENYLLQKQRDEDFDGLSNLQEADESNSDPWDADTDNDGMPDGWEHRKNLWRATYQSSNNQVFNLRSPAASGTGADADKHFEPSPEPNPNPESTPRNNLNEYRFNTHPYLYDGLPAPAQPNIAGAKSELININFGSAISPGMAAAGVDATDKWNAISINATNAPLKDAGDVATGAKITLLMNLGSGTRFTVTCSDYQQNGGSYFCQWLGLTNTMGWTDIFCCQNDSPDSSRSAHYFCLHSERGEALILSETGDYWTRAQFPRLTGAAGAPPPNYAALAPDSPWSSRGLPVALWERDGAWNYDSTVQRWIMERRIAFPASYVQLGSGSLPQMSPRSISQIISTAVTPGMEEAWVSGFDQSGTHTGSGLAGAGVLHQHYWNSKDAGMGTQPQSTDCNDFWFTQDGHGVIRIGPLPGGAYSVYLYAAKQGQTEPTPVKVNGLSVNIPFEGAQQTAWVEGSNFAVASVQPDARGMIELHFEPQKSLISGIQLRKEPPSATIANYSAENLGHGQIQVKWDPVPGFNFRVFRQIGVTGSAYRLFGPEVMIGDYLQQCSLIDSAAPIGVPVSYRIAAIDRWGRERGTATTASLTITPESVENINRPPILGYVDVLRHTFKNTPFVISTARLRAASDASDFDGDRISFEVTSVRSGTLKLHRNGTTTTHAAGVALANPLLLDTGTSVTWTPPLNGTGELPAFSVRATDGAERSAIAKDVFVEVKGDSVLTSWGYDAYGALGNGRPVHRRSQEIEMFWHSLDPNDQVSIDPAAVLIDEGETQAEAPGNRRLQNVIKLAIGYPWWEARAALKADGTVWVWGDGRRGCLGDGVTIPIYNNAPAHLPKYLTVSASRPVQVPSLAQCVDVAVGGAHVLALKADGTVWGWGDPQHGAVGVDPEPYLPIYAYGPYELGRAPGLIPAVITPTRVQGIENVVSIAAGVANSFAITESGELYYWGIGEGAADGSWEHTFRPTRIEVPGKVVQVSGDGYSMMILTHTGDVYGWGWLHNYMLGAAVTESRFMRAPEKASISNVAQVSMSGAVIVAVLRDGTVVEWGLKISSGRYGGIERVPGLQDIVKVSNSGWSALVLDSNRNVFGWGTSRHGNLGKPGRISNEDWALAASLYDQGRMEEYNALTSSPRWGFYRYPIPVETLEEVEDIASGEDGGFAVTRATRLGPGGLIAHPRDLAVELSWRRVAGASLYEVQRKFGTTAWTVVATVTDDPASPRIAWTDTFVENGRSYSYQVVAVTAGAQGEFSRVVHAVPNSRPGQVMELAAIASARQVQLIWNPDNRALNYEISRKVDGGNWMVLTEVFDMDPGPVTLCGGGSRTRAIAIHDVHRPAGILHTYRVRAVNQIGYGDYSQEVTVTPGAQGTDRQLTGIQVVSSGSYDATIKWPTRTGIPTGAKYVVELQEYVAAPRTTTSGAPSVTPVTLRVVDTLAPVPNGDTQVKITGLYEGRKYRVAVAEFSPCDGEGAIGYSSDIITPHTHAVPPNNGITVTRTGTGDRSLYAAWEGSAVSYLIELERETVPGTWARVNECQPAPVQIDPDDSGSAEFMQGNLQPGAHRLKIHTIWEEYSASLSSPMEIAFTVVDLPDPAPALPEMMVRKADNRMRVTWWGNSDETAWQVTPQFLGWRFILQRRGPGTPTTCPEWLTIYEGSQFGIHDEEVSNGSAYSYRLFGISPGATPEVRFAETSSYTPGATFANIDLDEGIDSYFGAVRLHWKNFNNVHGYSQDFEVAVSDVQDGPYRTLAIITGTGDSYGNHSYVDYAVQNGRKYFYRIRLRVGNTDVFESTELVGEPSEDADIVAPNSILAVREGDQLMLSWPEVPGAEWYTVQIGAGSPVIRREPHFSTAFAVSAQIYNLQIAVSANRRSEAPATYATVVAWNAPTIPSGQTLSHYSIKNGAIEAGRYTPASANETQPYIQTVARPSSTAVIHTVQAILTQSGANPINALPPTLPTPPAAPGNVTIAIGNDFGVGSTITTPTNIVVTMQIVGASVLEIPVQRVQFYVDGVLADTDLEPPFEFLWVNPKGSIAGEQRSLKARMVTTGWAIETPAKNVTVQIVPELMAFQTAETDLQIATAGVPLNASRHYDSRDLSSGMLGKGWKLDWEFASMSVPDLAAGWEKITSTFPLPQMRMREIEPRVIEVRLPGGSIQRFRPVAGPTAIGSRLDDDDATITSEIFEVYFTPIEGYSGVLSELMNNLPSPIQAVIPTHVDSAELERHGGGVLIPGDFEYTADGNTKLRFTAPHTGARGTRNLSLSRVEDLSGNWVNKAPLTGSNFQLDHSTGPSLRFVKAADNYSWDVYDAIGVAALNANQSAVPAVKYIVTYSGGISLLTEVRRLVNRTAATYETTKYQYDGSSRLIRVIGHDGVILLENTYDATRPTLLATQKGSMGLTTTVAATTENGEPVVNVSDNSGDGVTAQATLGTGGEIVKTQANNANEVSERIGYDHLGRPAYQQARNGGYTSFFYDRAGRVIGTIDALDNQNTVSYDRDGNLVSSEDGRGIPTRYDYYDEDAGAAPNDYDTPYNAKGMLRSVTDAEGSTTYYTYNKAGQILTEKKEPAGGGLEPLTQYKYNSNGRIEWIRDPLGSEELPTSNLYKTAYTYDANGNRLTEKRWRKVVIRNGSGVVTSDNTLEEMTTTFTYDGMNRLLTTVNSLNQTSSSVYNAQGKVSQSVNNLGQVTSYLYDPRGNLVQTTYPAADPNPNVPAMVSRTIYDAKGRAEWVQDRCVPGTGPGTPTTGPATKTIYDSEGRVIRTQRFEYVVINLEQIVTVNETQACTLNVNLRAITGTSPIYYRTVLSPSGTLLTSARTQYNTAGQVEFTVDQGGGLTQFVYDLLGRKTSVRRFPDYYSDPSAGTTLAEPTGTPVSETKFGYDENGNQSWVGDGLDRKTRYGYDRLNRQRVVYSAPVPSEGRLTFVENDVVDWRGFILRLKAHAAADKVAVYIWNHASFDAARTYVETHNFNDPQEVTFIKPDVLQCLQHLVDVQTIWDSQRFADVEQSWHTEDMLAIWLKEPTDERRKALNRLLLADAFPEEFADATVELKPKTQHTTYDGLGRKVAETDEAGVITLFKYDVGGRLIEVTNDFKPAGYSPAERPVVTRYAYDEVGNLRKEIKVDYAPHATVPGQLELDTSGAPIELLEQPATTSYEYDSLGRRTYRFLPGDTTYTDQASNSLMEKVTYEEVGTSYPKTLRKKVRDFRNITIEFNYDALDRLAMKKLPLVNPGEVERTVTYGYQGALMTQVSETGSGYSRVNYCAYDTLRRLRKKDTPEGVLTYTYNNRGSVQRMKAYRRSAVTVNAEVGGGAVPDADTEYGYDGLARLKTVTNHRFGTPNVSTYTYDLGGNLRQLAYPNLVRHSYAYTEQSRLMSVDIDQNTGSPALLRRFVYTMEPAGHRTSMAESGGTVSPARTIAYNYEEPAPTLGTFGGVNQAPPLPRLYRLAKETINPGAGEKVLSYTLDIRGNRLVRTVTGTDLPPAQSFEFDENDEMTLPGLPPVQFAYDANGNTLTSPTQADATKSNTDTYDTENRLVKRIVASGPVMTFGYDHDGHRVSRAVTSGGTTTTTYFLVDELNPTGYAQVVTEYKTTAASPTPSIAAFHQAYEYGLRIISQHQGTLPTQRQHYAHDGLGSTRFVTDSAANAPSNAVFDYDAYGNLISAPPTTLDIHFLFAGEQWDSSLGMYYNRARYYSPAHGRFWNRDSYEGGPEEPASLHKYIYCRADPLNRLDPSGNTDSNAPSLTTGSGLAGGTAGWGSHALLQANTRIMLNLPRIIRTAIWAEIALTGISFAPEALQAAANLGDAVNRQFSRNSVPISPGWATYGGQVEELAGRAITSVGGRYLGGTVKGIDGNLGLLPGEVLVQVKAHDVAEDQLVRTISAGMQKLAALDERTIQGLTVADADGNREYYRRPAGPVAGRVYVVGVPENRANLIVNPRFIQAIREAGERAKVLPVIEIVRRWTGRPR